MIDVFKASATTVAGVRRIRCSSVIEPMNAIKVGFLSMVIPILRAEVQPLS